MNYNTILIGCVADDFTGASDAASFLRKAGLHTILVNGIQKKDIDQPCDAIVVALKSRTQEKNEAINENIEAFAWLAKHKAQHLYFKYCSTFDSTKEGNIGPVLDALLEKYNIPYSILCPALPINKRIVKNGVLYVDDIPLSESHMKDHPLTPMWESRIDLLMKEQGKHPTLSLYHTQLEGDAKEITNSIEHYAESNTHFYIAPDFITEAHGIKIAEIFKDNYILSGGSGILFYLGRIYKGASTNEIEDISISTKGRGLVLAGSCSKMTKEQVQYFKDQGNITLEIVPEKLLNKENNAESIFSFVLQHIDKDVLIYSSGSGGATLNNNEQLHKQCADVLEKTLADVAQIAVEKGYTRIIVAGGETSSAITKKLGFTSFFIGESIEPGVPVMTPTENENIRLVLKSGNFGQKDFFSKALALTFNNNAQ